MDLNELLLAGVTLIVAWVLGYISKKSKFVSNNIIPIQNIVVGLVFALIEWVITKDFKVSIALAGLTAGGAYDILHNLRKLKYENEFELENMENEIEHEEEFEEGEE